MESTPFDQLMQHIIHTLEKNGYNRVCPKFCVTTAKW